MANKQALSLYYQNNFFNKDVRSSTTPIRIFPVINYHVF